MPRKLRGFLLVLILVNGSFAASKVRVRHDHRVRFRVLHNFTGKKDGCCILGGLARDFQGNLYGIAYSNNNYSGDGDLFKVTPTRLGYAFHVIQNFSASTGKECLSTPTIDRLGNLFGVCSAGGTAGYGTLWEYSRSKKFTVLHNFSGSADGWMPQDSVAVDKSGHIYGTTYLLGPGGSGTFWEYSVSSGAFTLLHSFADGDDGGRLPAGPKIDETGMVWGTTQYGPNCDACGHGTVWNYDPSSGTFTTILNLDSTDIFEPQSRVVIGKKGNVFGTAFSTLKNSCGIVYELQKDNNYAPIVVHEFTSADLGGCSPFGRVRFDQPGHLLGTTYSGGSGCGTVYELKHRKDGWHETILHSFGPGPGDGCSSQSGLITDRKGNWFGTTISGGKYTWGTVFEISGVN